VCYAVAAACGVAAIVVLPGGGVLWGKPGGTGVRGRVTYNGKPLEGGSVFFMPVKRDKTEWAAGVIRPGGHFTLIAYPPGVPLEPGEYDIFLRAPAYGTFMNPKRADRRDVAQPADSEAGMATPSYPIPARFLEQMTSGLRIRLDGNPQRIDLDLTD
jgi:hypothetical protein